MWVRVGKRVRVRVGYYIWVRVRDVILCVSGKY